MKSKDSKYHQKFTGDVKDPERDLVKEILKTGREQIKKRRKAGLSVYFLKEGRIIELKPNKIEIQGIEVESKWVTLNPDKRTLKLE